MNELSIFKSGEMTEENFEKRVVFSEGCSDIDLYNSTYGSNVRLSDYIGQEITITGISISTALVNKEMNDEKSGKIVKPCCCLMTVEYGALSTVSNGIYSSVSGLLKMVDFNVENVVAEITEINTKKGKAHLLKLKSIVKKGE